MQCYVVFRVAKRRMGQSHSFHSPTLFLIICIFYSNYMHGKFFFFLVIGIHGKKDYRKAMGVFLLLASSFKKT